MKQTVAAATTADTPRTTFLPILPSIAAARGAAAVSQLGISARRLVDGSGHLQTRDFVLYQQLATLQLFDLEIINRRMRPGFGNFGFQCPVLPLQFRKVRF